MFVAIQNIETGEELTLNYQFLETEVVCKCGSLKCRGILKFDQYKNFDWQKNYYKYSLPYVQRKIDELKPKWHSSRCFLKYYIENDQPRQLGKTI